MVLCSDWHERHISFSKVATIALINQKPYERYVSLNMNVTVTDTRGPGAHITSLCVVVCRIVGPQ
jgi:hypothetical protein